VAVPLTKHTVKKGENLTSVVKKYGVAGGAWKHIYKAKYNAAFRKKRTDPNLILPGDVFYVPSHSKAEAHLVILPVELVIATLEVIKNALKKLISALKAGGKNLDKLDEKTWENIRRDGMWIIETGRRVDAETRACKTAARAKPFGDFLKSCDKDHKKKMSALFSLDDGFEDFSYGILEDRDKGRKQLQQLQRAAEALLGATEKAHASFSKIRNELTNFASETF